MTDDAPPLATVTLSGWGRSVRRRSHVQTPDGDSDLARIVRGSQTVTVRGAGRSYGDASLASGGTVLDMTRRARIESFDPGTGIAVVEAGATLHDLVRHCQPHRWMPAVLPGTTRITVGGAVASDVHGKNHPGAGSFGQHVRWLTLLRGDGTSVLLSPDRDPDAFWATVGGMGLTGVIEQVAIQLRAVNTAWAIRNRRRTSSLPATLAVMSTLAQDQAAQPDLHVVAWLDAHADDAGLGRAIVDDARLAQVADLPSSLDPLASPARRSGSRRRTPSLPGPGVIGAATIAASGAARWHLSRSGSGHLMPLSAALHPLDRAEVWPAAFGRRGMIQYQFAVPDSGADAIGDVLHTLARHHVPPALAVLKRLGEPSLAPMSFPIAGWTLALDLPARWVQVRGALAEVDALVVGAGGRVYLAKDSVTDPASIASMYPRLAQWQRVQRRMDPGRRMTSALAERLHLLAEEHP